MTAEELRQLGEEIIDSINKNFSEAIEKQKDKQRKIE